jgi:hypothetical protein
VRVVLLSTLAFCAVIRCSPATLSVADRMARSLRRDEKVSGSFQVDEFS